MNFFQKLFGKSNAADVQIRQAQNEHEESTSDTNILLERAKKKLKKNNLTGASADIEAILKIDPYSIEAYMTRSDVKKKQKDEIGAKEDFEHAGILLKRLDKGLKAHEKGLSKFNEREYKAAIKHFNDAVSFNIDLGQTYHLRGLSKKYTNDYRGAVIDFTRVIDLHPDYEETSDIYYHRGKIKYHKLNDNEGALKDYNHAIKLRPNNADIYFSRAMLKKSMDDIDGAFKDYSKSIELNPSDAETFFSRALLYMTLENYSEAITDLENVIKLGLSDEDSVSLFDAYAMRASCKLLSKKYSEALIDFDKTIELEPENGKAYFERGEAWLLIGDNQKAAEDKLMAIKLGYEEED
jgi:tetratricopeptide (TPR) repeat protein